MTDSPSPARSKPRWPRLLKWARRAWLVLAGLLCIVFMIALPGTFQMLQTPCSSELADCQSWAQPTPSMLAAYEETGLSLQTIALYFTVLYAAVSLVFWMVGLLVFRSRRDQWFTLLVAYLMILMGTGGASLVFASGLAFTDLPPLLSMLVGVMLISSYEVISLFFLTFPNGRFYGRWNFIPFILICMNSFFWIVPLQNLNIEFWPQSLASAWLLLVFGSHLVVQVVRYRRMYTPSERQQTKWLLYGFSVPMAMIAVVSLLSLMNSGAALHPLVDGTLVTVLYLPIGLAVGIALLRYRLWDVDVVIHRTLVYGTLTAILVAVYALIVTALGRLVRDERSFMVSLIGAGVLAVFFQPLRDVLQRGISRLLFGRRNEPLAVVTALSRTLEAVLTPEAALAHLVEETARALKLPWVALERAGHADVIAFGASRLEPVRFPLIFQAQPIGALLAAPRSPSKGLNSADRLILEQVARQAGQVVQLSRLTDDLQRSRQEILTTREEERRRLRRDLHDGLGPALATLTLQAEAAKEWLGRKPDQSAALLDDIIAGTQQTLADIRRIVYDLRPPALDDLGLVSAIREQAAHYASDDLLITVEAPDSLPALPAAVEVATYRIVQEALTNVKRHAQARTCQVQLAVNGHMDIAIVDDGVGLPSPYRSGVGLSAIHERAAELGGSCAIASQPGAGTQIRVSLPRELAS